MRQTRLPASASAAPRLTVVVVLPTPPFWFMSAMIRTAMGPPPCGRFRPWGGSTRKLCRKIGHSQAVWGKKCKTPFAAARRGRLRLRVPHRYAKTQATVGRLPGARIKKESFRRGWEAFLCFVALVGARPKTYKVTVV